MTPTPTIFLDMDGVVANFVGAICAAHGMSPDKIAPGHWDIMVDLEISEPSFYKPCAREDFWTNMAPLPYAKEFVRDLRELAPVVLCSVPTPHAGAFSGKYKWAREQFGRGLPVILLDPTGAASKAVLARPGGILIDDNERNVNEWDAAGGIGLLYPTRHNSGHAWREAVRPIESAVHAEIVRRVRKALLWHESNVESAGGYGGRKPDFWRAWSSETPAKGAAK